MKTPKPKTLQQLESKYFGNPNSKSRKKYEKQISQDIQKSKSNFAGKPSNNPSSLDDLTQSIIELADRQDKYDDNITKLSNAQSKLQNTFDNILKNLNINIDNNRLLVSDINSIRMTIADHCSVDLLKSQQHEINSLRNVITSQGDTITKLSIKQHNTSDKLDATSKSLTDKHYSLFADFHQLIDRVQTHNYINFLKRIFHKI